MRGGVCFFVCRVTAEINHYHHHHLREVFSALILAAPVITKRTKRLYLTQYLFLLFKPQTHPCDCIDIRVHEVLVACVDEMGVEVGHMSVSMVTH